MMIHKNFPSVRKSLITSVGIFVSIALLFGCGGGGGGGGGTPPDIAPENIIPTATITSPTATQFNEGENIAFGGSATDEEDGPLDGGSLVWTSNIDGIIGTGTAVTTSALTAGNHEITLTATDSEGGVRITDPALITIAQTRFIKMGAQTTGVSDASNAFDGDHATAATIVTPETEFIYFKAHIGSADTFQFKIRLGSSTVGSQLAIQGWVANETWQPVRDVSLNTEKTTTIAVADAQRYKDSEGYIIFRARWEGGVSGDNATVFEIWRFDEVYPGPRTQGVTDSELAFDGNTDASSSARIVNFWGKEDTFDYLQIKGYVGKTDEFQFNILVNSLGNDQFMAIDVEVSNDEWINLRTLPLNTTNARMITVPIEPNYLDADRYISLRVRWVGYGSSNQLIIYDIWRNDPVFIGPKTVLGWIPNTENSVDGDLDSFATLFYHWGEADRYDFLHVQSYVGDTSDFAFSIKSSPSIASANSELIVEGEIEPDNWSVIERISLDAPKTSLVELLNSRPFVTADGLLSIRIRWENSTPEIDYDINIHEIWSEMIDF